MIWIGIDPGVHTGVGVWDSDAKRLEVYTMRIDQALRLVRLLWEDQQQERCELSLRVVVEDARQRRWIPREFSWSEVKGRAQGAGSIKRDCQIWEDFLVAHGIRYEMQPPRKGMTKWTSEAFARVTGYAHRTSNHGRDAAMLVFGR